MGIQIDCAADVDLTILAEVSAVTSVPVMRIQIEDNNDPGNPIDLADDGGKVVSSLSCKIGKAKLVAGTPFEALVNWRPISMGGGTASLFLTISQNGAPLIHGTDDAGKPINFDGNGRFEASSDVTIGAADLCDLSLTP